MADSGIKVRIEGELAYIAFNRPEKRNAIDQAMLRALPEAIDEVDRADVRAIIIYGEGQAFSAGIDFTSLSNETGARGGHGGGPDIQRFRRFVAESQASLNRIESVEKPVIGALHGFVGGLGLELALACDARIAAVGARLGMPEVRIGLVPDVGGTTRLTRTVGYARSKELIMTARMIEAADAEKIGLVNRVVAEGAHIAAAEELAREMARNAPLAVGLAKRIIDKGHGLDKMRSRSSRCSRRALCCSPKIFAKARAPWRSVASRASRGAEANLEASLEGLSGAKLAHPGLDAAGREIERVGRAGVRLERDDGVVRRSIDDEVLERCIGANLERDLQRRIDQPRARPIVI